MTNKTNIPNLQNYAGGEVMTKLYREKIPTNYCQIANNNMYINTKTKTPLSVYKPKYSKNKILSC
jgi:hypothetical protein